jgi:HK97 gp10 family phage protein
VLVDNLTEIAAKATSETMAVVQRAGADIVKGAMKRSRVETGLMRASWQTHTLGPFEIMVFNPVEYAIYNEYGTVNMSAQPMLRPAVEEVRRKMQEELAAAWTLGVTR